MKLNAFLERRSRAFIYVACLLLVVLLGVADYLNGPDISLLVFYAVPVLVAAWYAGRRAGFLMCAAGGLSYLAGAYVTTGHFSHPLIPYWNAAARLGLILILAHLIASFKRSFERERELARTDYLTGAFNGRSFGEVAEAEISRARRHAHPFTVAYMDVDDFKLVNDRHGHSAGDRLLQSVADTIRKNVRDIDTVARLGGDEFAVLMPETDEKAARTVVCRVRRQLGEVARLHGWHVTFSIGVVTWEIPPASVDEMLHAADDLMYSAKRLGKNTVRHAVSNSTANAA
jgi:diguanylate cyclase (GGDEF)-like protein